MDALQSAEAAARSTSSRTLEQWLKAGNPWRSNSHTQRSKQHPHQQQRQQITSLQPEVLLGHPESLMKCKPVDRGALQAPQLSSMLVSQGTSTPDGSKPNDRGSASGTLAMACGANRWLLQRICDYCQLMRYG